jgi:hypothetical protein
MIMPNEVGHAKNVANFESLKTICASLGSGYNPSNTEISVSKLNNKLTAAIAAMDDVLGKVTLDSTAINDRKDLYDQLKPTVDRVYAIYAASGADENDIEDVKGFRRKVYGRRATPKPVDDPATPEDESKKTKSSAQTGFADQIEHLDAIIEIVSNDAKYAPNEVDLQVTALQAYSAQLKAANSACIVTATDADNARIDRNQILYHPKTGLVALAKLVKTYVRGAFGPKSAEYNQIAALKFTNYKL